MSRSFFKSMEVANGILKCSCDTDDLLAAAAGNFSPLSLQIHMESIEASTGSSVADHLHVKVQEHRKDDAFMLQGNRIGRV